jgi:predicted O-linked N-acetylglucosamine transferase (SPINDLY family)
MASLPEAMKIAVSHHRSGRLDLAMEIYRRILVVDPDHADALHLYGMAAHQLGRHAEAVDYIRRAIGREADVAIFHNNLGEVYRATGELDAAVACYRRALELGPELAAVHNNLGNAWKALGSFNDAIACYERALELDPDYAEVINNLGSVWRTLGKADQAAACFRRALELRPQLVEVYSNLANALHAQGQLDEAVACARRATQLRPDFAEAHSNLANALQGQGELDESIDAYHQALRLAPDNPGIHSNYLCGLRYVPRTTAAELHRVAAEFDRRFAAPLKYTWQPPPARPTADRPLRLGFVSPGFALRPTGYFLVPALEHLDRRACEIVCYSDRATADRMTARIRATAATWHEVFGWSDERLAQQIREDQIDVLFDLAGHAPGNRLMVFARKPAPIQVTWIDSVGSTGLAAIDYLLADPYQVPPELDQHYAERVLRMPETYVCYAPPDDAPPVGPLPALGTGRVTFGSFNNPAKVAPEVVALWARILNRVPGSRLLLKYQGFDDPGTRRHYHELFARHGANADRLMLEGGAPHAELLACYGRVDIALDPIYNGGLTTCEALWMGVPVVTCPGETFPRRHALSHLSNVGLHETIARDANHYVELAVAQAGDLPRLADLRAGLRQRMAASPLCDGPRFATQFARLIRSVAG